MILVAPSTTAASSSSPGTARMNGRKMMTVIGSAKAASGRATPSQLSSRWTCLSRKYTGSEATLAGNSRPIANIMYQASRPGNLYRASANDAIAPSPTARPVTTTEISALLPRFCQKVAEVRIDL